MQYCEASIALNHFEPWNAWSNLAFIVAGISAQTSAQRQGTTSRVGYVLFGFAIAIGIGSFAWHATHQPWGEIADVVPILGFVLIFLYHALCSLSFSRRQARIGCGAMLSAIVLIGVCWPTALNGSLAYFPVLVGLYLLARLSAHDTMRTALLGAAAIFAVSLVLRTIDPTMCRYFPHGSHWGWHLLNGVVIFIALTLVSRAVPTSIRG